MDTREDGWLGTGNLKFWGSCMMAFDIIFNVASMFWICFELQLLLLPFVFVWFFSQCRNLARFSKILFEFCRKQNDTSHFT